MERRTSIEAPTQLLVEGNDQRNFFEAFAAHLRLHDVQVRSFDGVAAKDGDWDLHHAAFGPARLLEPAYPRKSSAADAPRNMQIPA